VQYPYAYEYFCICDLVVVYVFFWVLILWTQLSGLGFQSVLGAYEIVQADVCCGVDEICWGREACGQSGSPHVGHYLCMVVEFRTHVHSKWAVLI
jgi:hypothetical protein